MKHEKQNDRIYNGRKWRDVDGKPMYVQFPHIIYLDGKYYLYGSNKEFSNGKGIWHWGIKAYESDDLYNWSEVGLIIPPNEEDPDSPLYPQTKMDAPCILYNEKTKKWVCWLINMPKKKAFSLTSDSFFGPYTIVGDNFLPCGLTIGDFDLVKTEDGRAYIYFNNPHVRNICAELTEDYTGVKDEYTTLLEHPESVPYARESPAYFTRNGKHYLFTSGTTGFFPNPSEIAVSDTLQGPFETLGDPHVNDPSHTSFHSQIRSVFKVPGKKDLYLALADRWQPQHMDLPYDVYKEWYRVWCHQPTEEERARVLAEEAKYGYSTVDCASNDVSCAELVVLPITFEGDQVKIYWKDSFSLSDYE